MNEFKLGEVVSIKPFTFLEKFLFCINTGVWNIPNTGYIVGYRMDLIAYDVLALDGDMYLISPDRIVKINEV